MPKVRANATERWVNKTSAAAPEYQAGVQAPRRSWKQSTLASKDAHKAAVTQSLADDRWAKSIQASDDAYQISQSAGKGAERFPGGVAAGQSNYQQGTAKFFQVIEATSLPPRGPKGDPRNYERVKVMGQALRAAKVGKSGFAITALMALVAAVACAVMLCASRVNLTRASGGDVLGIAMSCKTGTDARLDLATVGTGVVCQH